MTLLLFPRLIAFYLLTRVADLANPAVGMAARCPSGIATGSTVALSRTEPRTTPSSEVFGRRPEIAFGHPVNGSP